MSIEAGQKYIDKDGEVVDVISLRKNYYGYGDFEYEYGVWFEDREETLHVLIERDFLEQYKPEPVYEYQFLCKVKDGDCWDSVTVYHKDIQECINSECEEERERYEYQRLDFTKRERKQ